MKRQKYRHTIYFGNGTLYPAGSENHTEGQFQPTIGDTYLTWHLIPTSRPTIAMPGVETKFVSIPGRDGSLDLSEFLHGDRPAYGNRSGTFNFVVENDFDPEARPEEFWMTIYPKLLNAIHGKKFKMVLPEDDPDYYWEGRFTVDKYDPGDGSHSEVAISYALNPFKRRIRKVSEGTVWDNFNFEKDYDADPLGLSNVAVGGARNIDIWGDGYPFPLEVTGLIGTVTVQFNGDSVTVNTGETRTVGHAAYGINTVTLSGVGSVSLDWRGGSL